MKMSVDDMIAVLQAHKDGKTIEMRFRTGTEEFGTSDEWTLNLTPNWDFQRFDYRVKPEPPREWVLVPMRMDDDGEYLYALRKIYDKDKYLETIHVREVLP